MATTVNLPRDTTINTTMKDLSQKLKVLAAMSCAYGGAVNWQSVAQLVRNYGNDAFPIGSKLVVPHSVYGNMIAEAVDISAETDPFTGLQRNVLQMQFQKTFPLQWGAPQALYYVSGSTLAAGTYKFTCAGRIAYTADNGLSFQFTLANAAPAGTQFVLNAAYNLTLAGKTIKVYSGPTSTTLIEEVTITQGSAGTSLGTTDGTTANLNYITRCNPEYGSTNWMQSGVRQYLNSQAAAGIGSVWMPQTSFDRPPTWAATTAGFMAGFGADFLSAIGKHRVITRSNSVYETGMSVNTDYNTNDYFYLPSYTDVTSGPLDTPRGLNFYAGQGNAQRVKYDSTGVPKLWMLRTPYPGTAHNIYGANTDGSTLPIPSVPAYGVAPMFAIY